MTPSKRARRRPKEPDIVRFENLTVPVPFEAQVRPAKSNQPRELILLLHGYNESGPKMFERLVSVMPDDAVVVAPNGTFPVPYKKGEELKIGFSWYFFHLTEREYYIDMAAPLEFLEQGIRLLKLDHLPKRLIGFSQGGYLAPVAAQRLRQVSRVIGIGCEYLGGELAPKGLGFQVDGIHGSEDEIVSAKNARESFESLRSLGNQGRFHLLKGGGHRIDDVVRAKVKELLGP